jgi:retron-type reverse transcriptase
MGVSSNPVMVFDLQTLISASLDLEDLALPFQQNETDAIVKKMPTDTIQDCLAWSFEYIHQCHYSRRKAIILKLDFEKAFDTIEHTTILKTLQQFGFPEKWVAWISSILSSGLSVVLLNGVPGKIFKCKRGVRQGDPLSPLLFVIAAELLQVLINKAASQGLLKAHIPHDDDEFPIIQYADDTLLIL